MEQVRVSWLGGPVRSSRAGRGPVLVGRCCIMHGWDVCCVCWLQNASFKVRHNSPAPERGQGCWNTWRPVGYRWVGLMLLKDDDWESWISVLVDELFVFPCIHGHMLARLPLTNERFTSLLVNTNEACQHFQQCHILYSVWRAFASMIDYWFCWSRKHNSRKDLHNSSRIWWILNRQTV
jgi:hypothetical protein